MRRNSATSKMIYLDAAELEEVGRFRRTLAFIGVVYTQGEDADQLRSAVCDFVEHKLDMDIDRIRVIMSRAKEISRPMSWASRKLKRKMINPTRTSPPTAD